MKPISFKPVSFKPTEFKPVSFGDESPTPPPDPGDLPAGALLWETDALLWGTDTLIWT